MKIWSAHPSQHTQPALSDNCLFWNYFPGQDIDKISFGKEILSEIVFLNKLYARI